MAKKRWDIRRRMYVNGVNPATGKKIAEYAFREALIKFDPNPDNKTYDVYIKQGVIEDERNFIQDFLDNWGEGWRINPTD